MYFSHSTDVSLDLTEVDDFSERKFGDESKRRNQTKTK